MYALHVWIFLLKTATRHLNVFWQCAYTCIVVVLLAGCGQPIQIGNRTPRPSGTPLVGTASPVVTGDTIQATTVDTSAVDTSTTATVVADATVIADTTPTVSSAITVVITPIIRATPTGDERWTAFVANRSAYDTPQRLQALAPTPLLWLDPHNGQVLEIGYLNGEFFATAQLALASNGQSAYEVDYVINQDYGLTSISRALVTRMNDAGYAASVRAFVQASDNIVPAP